MYIRECANEGPAVHLFSPENTITQTKTIVCYLSAFLCLQIVLGMAIMEIQVVEFSNGGYKIRKNFA